MGANDRAVQYAKERLAAVIEVLAEMETHQPVSERFYAVKLREALALGHIKLSCSCAVCVPPKGT